MKKLMAVLCSMAILSSIVVSPVHAAENRDSEKAEIISVDESKEVVGENESVDYLTDKTRGKKKPSTSSTWDIYLQDYVFNLDFTTALYSNYNFSNHGGEIKVTVTCNSSNPDKIKMELYEAGGTKVLATLDLNPNGTTTGRFYNLDLKTNYYYKFVSPNDYSVTGKGRLYKD